MRRAALVVLVVAAVPAGCGGGTKTYHLAPTRTCLAKHHLTIEKPPLSDFVATTATGGSFRAVLPANFVTISLGENQDDAVQLEKAYHRFAFANVKKGLSDVLKRDANVVMLWHEHPQPDHEALVLGCLK